MKQVIITKGLPASGKTTWAKQFIKDNPGWKRVNKDDLRQMIDDGAWSPINERFIIEARNKLIWQALVLGFNVVIDDTNLDPVNFKGLEVLITAYNDFQKKEELKVQIQIKDFTNVSLEDCMERDRKRTNPVGYKVIKGMYYKYVMKPRPKLERILGLPDAIICDLDGTLSLFEGKRGPYDASKCDEDDLNETVAGILRIQEDAGDEILFVSGRKDTYREQTKTFLGKHGFNPDHYPLFMRKGDDERKDWIVKQEIYDAEIKEKYNIRFVLDDRDQVVEMWRRNGLTCLQVADGTF